jgi:hypothetical protein
MNIDIKLIRKNEIYKTIYNIIKVISSIQKKTKDNLIKCNLIKEIEDFLLEKIKIEKLHIEGINQTSINNKIINQLYVFEAKIYRILMVKKQFVDPEPKYPIYIYRDFLNKIMENHKSLLADVKIIATNIVKEFKKSTKLYDIHNKYNDLSIYLKKFLKILNSNLYIIVQSKTCTRIVNIENTNNTNKDKIIFKNIKALSSKNINKSFDKIFSVKGQDNIVKKN